MSQKQDKAKIYNSKEWKQLRTAKLNADPLCEECKRRGKWVSATCVHHKTPIETAHTFEDMKRLAFCGLAGLQSLCYQCHSDIHRELASRTREGHQKAAQSALERWAEGRKPKQ